VGYFEIRRSLTTPLRRAILAATVTDRLFDVSDIVRLLEAAESKKAAWGPMADNPGLGSC